MDLKSYNDSTPRDQLRNIKVYKHPDYLCPLCGRVPKWYYRYYEPSGGKDSQFRCTFDEIVPTPGPDYYPEEDKVNQLY